MRTRSSSNLPIVSPSNPSTSNTKRRNRRRSKQPFTIEESPVDTMADQRTMAELLRAPTKGYAKAIMVPSILAEQFELKHSLINMMTLNQDSQTYSCSQSANECCNYRHDGYAQTISPAYQDSLNAAAGGNLLERQIAKLTHAVNQQTSAVTTAMTAMLKQFQATSPPASVKAVEDTCVTCGAAVNYNQGNLGYRSLGFNRGNNFNLKQSYQAPTQQNQNVNELEKVKRMNEANMKAMQTQINMVKNELRNEMKNSIQASLSNQTNEIKNIMAGLFQMNTASTSGTGSLPSNIVANLKSEIKVITICSGLVLDGPTVPTPTPFINPEEDERVEETLTNPDIAKYTIKVPHPPAQKYKPPSQREYVVHQRDPFHSNIPYPSRMLKQKQQEKDEVQIHKFWKMFKQLHINITLVDALNLMPNELKCKALAGLGGSINLMPLSVWKKLGLPELIFTRMTLELANRTICTPAEIARDVFVPVGKFTFPTDSVIVDYESDPRVPLILGRPFLRTARTLINVHGEEMILCDGDERLTLNMRHDTSSYSNQPHKESINLINVSNNFSEDFLEDLFSNQPSGNLTLLSHPELTSPEVKNDIFDSEGGNVLPEKFLDLDSTKDLHPPLHVNPLSGSTTYFSNPLLEEFADEIALMTFPPKYNDDLQFDVESDLKEIEFMLYQDTRFSLKDSIYQSNLANLADNFVDSIPEMFTNEHALDYSSPLIFDEYDDDFLKVESDTKNIYDDPFDSKGEKIKESKLLIDELDLPCDFLPPFEYDSFISQDFSRVDDLPSTKNEDKIFNPDTLIQEKPFEIITRVVQDKKLAISNASLVLEDFDPPFYEPLFFKEVSSSKMLLLFSSENKEKVFKPEIHTSEKVNSSHIPELSHQGYKVFKIN
nr:hypothetical protein [Tanacetum cinerariifolium]